MNHSSSESVRMWWSFCRMAASGLPSDERFGCRSSMPWAREKSRPSACSRSPMRPCVGSFQAAEQTGVPIEIVGEEASAGVLEGVKEKGGKATSYVQEAIQGAMAAVEESVAKLKEKASEVAEKSRKALQSLIERLKGSPQGIGGGIR